MAEERDVIQCVSWDGSRLAHLDVQEEVVLSEYASQLLGLIPETATLQCCYWPLELLLVRTFFLPLSHPRLLDAEIVGQELSGLSGIDTEAWWLIWYATVTDEGVEGVAFALPESIRASMQVESAWQQCPRLLVDGWQRLSALVSESDTTCMIMDVDADGVFMAYLNLGVWKGIRRVNVVQQGNEDLDSGVVDELLRSVQAMGMDLTCDYVIGQADTKWKGILSQYIDDCRLLELSKLPSRHEANLRLAIEPSPEINFRTGVWSAKRSWLVWGAWRRPALIISMFFFAWLAFMLTDIVGLKAQVGQRQLELEQAFHRGLPHEIVMLDVLAQLRKASGTDSALEPNRLFLGQLQWLSQAYGQSTWKLQKLVYDQGKIKISGVTNNLNTLNKFKALLEKNINRKVMLTDTDLSDNQVSFRMHW